MAEEEKETSEAKSGGGKGMIIVLIALVVILLLAVVGGGYFLYSEMMNKDSSSSSEEQKVVKADASGEKAAFQASINDLVLNITNAKGREKLMKLSFTLKSSEETIAALVEENKAEIVDIVIAQISARSSEELLTVGGKALLKEELLEELNSIINEATSDNPDIKRNSVKKLFFTSFVIK